MSSLRFVSRAHSLRRAKDTAWRLTIATQVFHLVPLAATLVTIIGVAEVSHAFAQGGEFLERLLRTEAAEAQVCPAALQSAAARALLIDLVQVARERLASHSDPAGRVAVLNRLIFDELKVRPSSDLHDPCNLLPSAVVARKQGYCVGIVALYVLLAEEMEIPIHAVAAPSHVFVRYDDGRTRINIETMASGATKADEIYMRELKIPDVSVRKGVFLRNLTAKEFLAQVYNNLGVIYSERGKPAEASERYARATDLDRRLAAAWYNWGNDLLRSGKYPRAIKVFTRSLTLYPTDVWALNNRGLAYRQAGKEEKALRGFEEAVRIEPGFAPAQQNLERRATHTPPATDQ